MTDDATRALIAEANVQLRFGLDEDIMESTRIYEELITALEAATAEPEWEYRVSGPVVYNGASRYQVEQALARGHRVMKRIVGRDPGPWVPVEAEQEGDKP